ncbi:MAG: D-alanine--D-alanine ligase [Actinobacteria bacterium]|nr:MAG: D-alanine--D-alanine ligase [Actinomycetota bacterium]
MRRRDPGRPVVARRVHGRDSRRRPAGRVAARRRVARRRLRAARDDDPPRRRRAVRERPAGQLRVESEAVRRCSSRHAPPPDHARSHVARSVVAVLFGGRSCEHEVSILTAHEALSVLRRMPDYDPLPVYVTKDGRWLTGPALDDLDKFADPAAIERECRPVTLQPGSPGALVVETGGLFGKRDSVRIDVALPLIHGPNGEDGTLQGTLEMLGIPYAGSGVLGSALCMDKAAMKRAFTAAGLPQVPYTVVTRAAWDSGPDGELARASALGEKLFVKPVRGGSSIGVTFVETGDALAPAIDLALEFDCEAVVEAAVADVAEVNCAVLRDGDTVLTSTLEAVAASGGFLTFDQKYLQWSKGAPSDEVQGHVIPAPLPPEKAERISALARAAFEACSCDGVARVDFLLSGDEVFVNEINTVPGSLSFYLWEPSGVTFDDLLGRMLRTAVLRAERRSGLTYSLDRNLLEAIQERKGAKGPKRP